MPSLPADGAPSDGTPPSGPQFLGIGVAALAGLLGAVIGYEAAEKIGQCAVCAASRSPLTVGLYLAVASAIAAWTLTSRRRVPPR